MRLPDEQTMKDQHNPLAWQSERQRMLVEINVSWLRQALAVVASIGDIAFSHSPAQMAPHT